MKSAGRLATVFTIMSSLMFLGSCEKRNPLENDSVGIARFAFSLSENVAAKSGLNDSINSSFQLMVSLEDLQGRPVLTDKMIPVYPFGTGFVSESIEIKAGEYNLVKFIVIDTEGRVIFASPLEGSPLAYLINDPLPLYFSVNPGQVTDIIPEVLVATDYSPTDFGYASFGVQIIKPLEFWAICYLDNPLIMAPTQITDAKLTVFSEDGWSYTFYLKAEVNHIIIRGGSEFYKFLLEKEGYASQTLQFSARELMNTSKEQPLGLKIPWGPQYNVLELQPGPEQGKDAMISNLEPDKNFGDHKYFEATFLSEPILTVMRSNRSLIAFSLDSLPKSALIKNVILRLSFDLPIPYDSAVVAPDPATGVALYGAVLQQVIEPWDEHKVTWNNQPKTTEMNQVFFYPFIRNANFIDLDVTLLFVNPSASALPFYGMLFKEWPDNSWPGFRFASSDFPDPVLRPKLIIYYTV
jgi:hypothetical protein